MTVRTVRAGWQRLPGRSRVSARDPRLVALAVIGTMVWLLLIVRLFSLQVLQHDWYMALASGQRDLFEQLMPERGEIAVHDRATADGWFPIATNERTFTIYAVPVEIGDAKRTAGLLAPLLGYDADAEVTLATRIAKVGDPYEPIARHASTELRDSVLALQLPGIAVEPTLSRFYPDGSRMAHLTGFVGEDESGIAGRYGMEGAYDAALGGSAGFLSAERDPSGRRIVFGQRDVERARDGANLFLTIEREVQLEACRQLEAAVATHHGSGGTVVIVHPLTGAIRAMCIVPSFDPNAYAEATDIDRFNPVAITGAYEPGSVFKPITMAAAIDAEVVTPATTFEDTGSVTVDGSTITNTQGRVYGRATMADVLRFSINTGTVYAARKLGIDRFRSAVERFGFGAQTGIELASEAPGDLSNLKQRREVYLATASYGQGIAVTPLQLAVAYAAIANGGKLMVPYLVEEVRETDGTRRRTEPRVVHEVMSARTATLLQGMLVSVVRDGYPKRAGVPGYLIGGKTGTAQIPLADRPGYSQDTIHTFAGIGPVDRPTFAMVVRIDRPQRPYADATAAPLFGSIAKFLLQYDGIPPRE